MLQKQKFKVQFFLTLHCLLVVRKTISLTQRNVSQIWLKNLIIGINPKQDKHKGNKNQEGKKMY